MPPRSFSIALLLCFTALPLACSGTSSTENDAGGTSGRAGTSGKAGSSGKAGASMTSPGGAGGRGGAGGTGIGFGTGGVAGSGFGQTGAGGAFGGTAGTGFEASGGTGATGSGGQSDAGTDLGGAERRQYCLAVCAYGPSPSSRLASSDSGAAGTVEAGAPGTGGTGGSAGGAPGSGGEEQGGTPGSAGEGGAAFDTPCGHVDECVAVLCPTQSTAHCGELLTAFVECMANADPDVVASLVTSCTQARGPSLDTLIYQACYGEYADWTRGCL